VWLVGNMVASSVSSTGAFEIFFNGQLLFSKLAAGRLPTAQEFESAVLGPIAAAAREDPERFLRAMLTAEAARAPPPAVPTPGGGGAGGAPRGEL
jgi:hypothetical protein